MRTAAIVGTANAVTHHQQQRYAEKDQAQYEEQQAAAAAAAPPPVAAPAQPDLNAELTQLAQLHDQGILTDEEFAAKKAQLLGI